MESSIYFVTSDSFKSNIIRKYDKLFTKETELKMQTKNVSVELGPTEGSESRELKMVSKATPDIILDFSAVNYVDTNGVKAIRQLIDHFSNRSINVFICGPQGSFYFIC